MAAEGFARGGPSLALIGVIALVSLVSSPSAAHLLPVADPASSGQATLPGSPHDHLSGIIELDGVKHVAPNETLVIDPGSIISATRHLGDGDHTTPPGEKPSITLAGKLLARGTPNSPVEFQVPVTLVDTEAVAQFERTAFRVNPADGPGCQDRAKRAAVPDLLPAEPGTAALCIREGLARVHDSQFNGNSVGIHIGSNGSVLVADSRFQGSAIAVLAEAVAEDAFSRAIHLTGNVLAGSGVAEVNGEAAPSVGLVILGDPAMTKGTAPWGGDILVEDNLFHQNGLGLYLGSSVWTGEYSHNQFTANSIGLAAHDARATLEGQRFSQNSRDILASGVAHVTVEASALDRNRVFITGASTVVYNGEMVRETPPEVAIASFLSVLITGAALALRWAAGKGLLPWPLYTRLSKRELLEEPTRMQILRHLETVPGLHERAIARAVGNRSTVRYHLRVLERSGAIVSHETDGYRRYFLPNQDPQEPARQTTQQMVVGQIEECPGTNQTEVAKALGLSRQVVSYHVNNLAEAGVLSVEESGRETRIYVGGATNA